jgi:hypothetical protein
MTRRAQDNVAALCFAAVFIGVIVLSLDFGPRARMIPLPLAIIGLLLTVAQLVWQNVRSVEDLRMDMIEVNAPPAGAGAPSKKTDASSGPSWRREVGAILMVAILLGLVLALGPIPAIFVFTWGYFFVTRQYSWLKGLIYTSIMTASVYALFVLTLEVQLYHGLLTPLMERLR